MPDKIIDTRRYKSIRRTSQKIASEEAIRKLSGGKKDQHHDNGRTHVDLDFLREAGDRLLNYIAAEERRRRAKAT